MNRRCPQLSLASSGKYKGTYFADRVYLTPLRHRRRCGDAQEPIEERVGIPPGTPKDNRASSTAALDAVDASAVADRPAARSTGEM